MLESIVVISNFDEYLKGGLLEPIGSIPFEEVPILDITKYMDLITKDKYMSFEGGKIENFPEEVNIYVVSAKLGYGKASIPLRIQIGHLRKEDDIYILDRLFQLSDPTPTQQSQIVGLSMASLLYHYAKQLQSEISLPNNK